MDGMNYLAGKNVDWINKMAMQGTLDAHENTGGVPNLLITVDDMSAKSFGYLCYFFFRACAMTCNDLLHDRYKPIQPARC